MEKNLVEMTDGRTDGYQNGQIWGMDKDSEKERWKCADQLENNQEEIFLTDIDWFSAQVLIDQKCFKAD